MKNVVCNSENEMPGSYEISYGELATPSDPRKTRTFILKLNLDPVLTHCGREDLWKWTIFNTMLTSPKSWISQEDLDAGFEHSLMPMDS